MQQVSKVNLKNKQAHHIITIEFYCSLFFDSIAAAIQLSALFSFA
jgi:hypothetical protein